LVFLGFLSIFTAGSEYIRQTMILGRRQVVRHRPLEPTSAGSNPAAPAIKQADVSERGTEPAKAIVKDGLFAFLFVELRGGVFVGVRGIGM
jgi:hypothetical protein